MPFVRFSRDRRGYEHLYLIDSSGERGGRSRVLYWFRTPPGVKVGRTPFDPETQRVLERQYPGVHFDWPQIVAAKIPPPAPVESWREKRRAERAIKQARAMEAAEVAELERFGGEETPLGRGGQEAGAGIPDLVGEELPSSPDGTSETQEIGAAELTVDQDAGAEDRTQPQAGEVEAADAPRRPRRRRRRRGRRSAAGGGPSEEGIPAAENGPLDQAEPAETPSDED